MPTRFNLRSDRTDGDERSLAARLDDGLTLLLGLVAIVWVVEFVNLATGNSLLRYGILPRNLIGLRGIVLAPFLHAGLAHIVANTVPLLVLGGLVMVNGRGAFIRAWVTISLIGGGLTWLFGRPAFHVGASGIIFGFLGYLVTRAWVDRHPVAIVLGLAAAVLYGGALWGLLPLTPGVSWEGHLFGLVGGCIAARMRAGGRPRRDLEGSV